MPKNRAVENSLKITTSFWQGYTLSFRTFPQVFNIFSKLLSCFVKCFFEMIFRNVKRSKSRKFEKVKNDVFEMKYFRKMSNLFFRAVFAFYKTFSRKVKNNRLKLKNKIEQLRKIVLFVN